MAKFSRYDPRNKKNGKHKYQSKEKDIRIREVIDSSDGFNKHNMLKEVTFEDNEEQEFLND